jgi:membrane-associated protein
MDTLHSFVDHILHLNKYLPIYVQAYGPYIYGILFGVIFIETGVVIWPWLPGDSLLFTVGALSAVAQLNVVFAWVLLTIAALMGDHSNYWIGRFFGVKVGRFVNKKYLDKTHEVYEKHGVQTLILFQFAPIFRTIAPFVAGVGHMTYRKFARYNLIGVLSWTLLCIGSGYFFGNLPWVNQHFEVVILGIVFVSLIPTFIEVGKAFFRSKKNPSGQKMGKRKRA